MKKQKTAVIFALCLFVIALIVTAYPLISNYFSEKNRSEIRSEYFETVEKLDDTALETAFAAAREYNELLASGFAENSNLFSDESINNAANGYEALLNVNGNSIMGYVDIPKLDIYLPICHGTNAETLDVAVGHVIGSSLPVGGNSTHSVLSAHSGMATQKMFSDLNVMRQGDVFYIHVLQETLAYKVDQVAVVYPEDTSLLKIEQDRDLVTLVTCTPITVNTHRLLVRGTRIDYEEAEQIEEEQANAPVSSTWLNEYIEGVATGFAILLLLLILYFIIKLCGHRGKPHA